MKRSCKKPTKEQIRKSVITSSMIETGYSYEKTLDAILDKKARKKYGLDLKQDS